MSDHQAPSRAGMWDNFYEREPHTQTAYGDALTMRLGAWWLNTPEIKTIEDWGAGFGGFKPLVAEHQQYIGLDGSASKSANKIVDFEEYTSAVDGAHMRHVIEHNYGWSKVLNNFCASFTKRGVLTLFTPFTEDDTHVDKEFDWEGFTMPNISFNRVDIESVLEAHGITFTLMSDLQTETEYGIEHIYLLERLA